MLLFLNKYYCCCPPTSPSSFRQHKTYVFSKKGTLASAKRRVPDRHLFCRNAFVGITKAKLIILYFHKYAFSSEIHFCNTSNVLASFFEGGSPLGASLGGLFFHENHIISLVLCVFAPQGSVPWNCFKNVCIYVFHMNLALKCLILHVYMAVFCRPRDVAEFTDVTLT